MKEGTLITIRTQSTTSLGVGLLSLLLSLAVLMIDRGRSKVIYTVYSDPGGFAPGFIANGVIRNVSF